MSTQVDELLSRLEEVNTQAVEGSDPEMYSSVDPVRVLEFIRERGQLIEQLKPVLASYAPVSYQNWNRLVVIHHQGDRILENLNVIRNRLALEFGASASGRVFLERMTGTLTPAQNEN